VQEICGCDSNSAFTTLPSAAGTPLFMFLAKKMKRKSNAKFRWRLISASRKIHFVAPLNYVRAVFPLKLKHLDWMTNLILILQAQKAAPSIVSGLVLPKMRV